MISKIFFERKYSNMLISAASAGAVLVSGIGSAQATTYYVSALTGKSSNSGKSTTAPLKTIGAIVSSGHLASGDTVVVMPGTYNETVNIDVAGKPSAYTTLMAQPGAARPVIIGAPTQANSGPTNGAIGIHVPYVRVTGFDVSWNGTEGDAIQSYGAKVADSHGTLRPTVHHLDIEDNIAHDAGCGGINVIFADYVTVKGNIVYNNGHNAPNQCSGISLYELTDFDNGSGSRNVISANLSYDNINLVSVPGTKYTTDGNGIIIDDSRHSQSDNAAYHGSTLIYGNIVVANGARGIAIYESDNVTVANNTAFENQQSTTINGPLSELSSDHSGKISFVNNIAYSRGATAPAFVDYYSSNDTWDYNLSTGGGNALTSPVALTIGTHNLAGANPQFLENSTNLGSADFQLAKNSPALKAGLANNYGVADFAGTVMASGVRPNLGAYTH